MLNEEVNLSRLSRHLQSISQQGHEVIIVDGGSIDNTLAVAHEISDMIIVSKAGRALQMNSGADIASGELLLFLHADTLLPDDALRVIADSSQDKDYWGRFDVRLSSNKLVYRVIERLMNLRSCFTSIATGDQAIFIRRGLFDRIGGFQSIPLMEDIALSRALKQSCRPVCIKQKIESSPRRWHKHGVIRTVLSMWGLRLAYYVGVSPEQLAKYYAVNRE